MKTRAGKESGRQLIASARFGVSNGSLLSHRDVSLDPIPPDILVRALGIAEPGVAALDFDDVAANRKRLDQRDPPINGELPMLALALG